VPATHAASVPATHGKKEGYLARYSPHQNMCFGTRVLIYVPAVLKSNEKRPTHASCVAQKHYICNSENSRRLLRFTFANGPRLFSRQIAQVEFSGSQNTAAT